MAKTKKKRVKLLDDLARAKLNHLAKHSGFGFSYRVLASIVFFKTIDKVTDKERACVASYFCRRGAKVTDWREAKTTESFNFITNKSKLPRRRRRGTRRRARIAA